MKEKCEGIVEWFKQDEGYGSILIDGIEESHVLYTLAQSHLIQAGFLMVLDTFYKGREFHFI